MGSGVITRGDQEHAGESGTKGKEMQSPSRQRIPFVPLRSQVHRRDVGEEIRARFKGIPRG